MKKIFTIAVCFIAIFSMFSCTDDSPIEAQNENASAQSKVNVEQASETQAGGDDINRPKPKI